MNHLSKLFGAVCVALTLTACHKEKLQPSGNAFSHRIEKNAPPCTMVLIPTQLRPRIGFLPDGATPWGMWNYPNLIHGVTNGANTAYQVYNPNLYAGLPADISYMTLSGFAVDRGANPYNPRLIFSYSNSSQHYLFFADLDANSNYPMNAQLILNATFAPASGGWKLHDIEYEAATGRMYGIFYKSSTNQSIVGNINTTTGVCTSVKSYPGVRFLGMDFTVSSGNPAEANKMYLLSDQVQSSGTFGVLYTLDLVTLASSSTGLYLPDNSTPPAGGLPTSFLARVPNSWDHLHIYGEGTAVFKWNKAGAFIQSTVTQKQSVILPSTLNTPIPIFTEAMTDAAN
jgi:hypothetical protein